MTEPLSRELIEAEREGFRYRLIAGKLACRLACADPAEARRVAAEIEHTEGKAGKRIAALLREDADWSEDKEMPLKLAG